jgi:hypothetical protein
VPEADVVGGNRNIAKTLLKLQNQLDDIQHRLKAPER